NCAANRLARYLREQGVGPDELVAICLHRGLDMIVAVLGALKAGGAYVPLDPAYPRERLEYMLSDACPRVLVTQEALRHALAGTAAPLLAMDTESVGLQGFSDGNLLSCEGRGTAANLVYVIYTSGSTGRPKGTAMPHGAMVNLIEWHRRTFPDRVGRRVLQFAALSFDVAFQ